MINKFMFTALFLASTSVFAANCGNDKDVGNADCDKPSNSNTGGGNTTNTITVAPKQTNTQSNGQSVTIVNEGSVATDKLRTVPDVVLGSPATVVCGGISGGIGITTLGGGLVANMATVNEKCDIRENIRILSSILPALPAKERSETLKLIMYFIDKLKESQSSSAPMTEDNKVRN